MIFNNAVRMMRSGRVSVALAVTLCFSSLSWAQPQEEPFAAMISKFALVPPGKPESEMLAKATAAVNFIKRMELPQASRAINEALQLDARNSYLHFLNGFIYHLQARQGDTQKNEMAIEGYQQALRIDPSNWIAQEFLGLAYIDLRQFAQAKDQFSEALLMSPESTVSIYGLMVASYMTGDPAPACAMADQFRKHSREPHSGFVRSSVSVYASCGDFEKADLMRAELGKSSRDSADVERVDRRLAQWKSFYRTQAQAGRLDSTNTAAGFIQANLGGVTVAASPDRYAAAFTVAPPPPPPPPAAAAPSAPGVGRPEMVNDGSPRMVLVDVVMVSTQELVATSKGINLLHALTLQLGSATAPAFSRTYNSTAAADVSTVITRAVTIPALAYSLNIANANNSLNEVLARPTLAAIEGLPSEFFSGMNLNAAVISTSALGTASAVPVDKRFGVKLAVTPTFLPNGMVKMKVDAQRTFLNANVDSAGFAYRLEISETSSNANVVMNLGDTLVLSGLSEKESSSSRTGVPGLQDVPGVQYFFSTKRTSDFQRSVLILITPRSPVYTSRSEQGQTPAASESMKALREKLGFSGRTPSNIESILNHLRTTNLFREFRQGDVSLERWDRLRTTGDRLRQAVEFLYY
jgi:pilus assembly protein CpaC